MKGYHRVRGTLAVLLGALALWKGAASAEVVAIDRSEAASVRGQSDAPMMLAPLAQAIPKMSCVTRQAKTPCNEQASINNSCPGSCPTGEECILDAGGECFFCDTPGGTKVRECMKSAVFSCYATTGAAVACGNKVRGKGCATESQACLTGAACLLDCKPTKVVVDVCPAINDGCRR